MKLFNLQMERIINRKQNKIMSKSKKILNYIAMVCAIMAVIDFCISKDWDAALWALTAFIWIVNCHLTEDSYYALKKN